MNNEKKQIDELTVKFSQSIERFETELKSFKTGRANPSMLDNLKIEAYGSQVSIKQVASVNVVDANLLQLSPFDPTLISSISTAIRNDTSLGLNPSDDGRVIRLPIPSLTEERRLEIVKSINQKSEECLVRVRAARHETLKNIDELKKDKILSQEEYSRIQKQIEDLTQKQKIVIDQIAAKKEKEIMTI